MTEREWASLQQGEWIESKKSGLELLVEGRRAGGIAVSAPHGSFVISDLRRGEFLLRTIRSKLA